MSAAETAHVFAQFEPSVFTIKNLAVPQGQTGDIRLGYIPSVAMALGISGAIAYLIKSILPVVASMIVAGFTISVYEYSIWSGQKKASG